ncbi:MAG: hypothetical protein WB764_01965 [Xanthobacteraceae bacterium]
MRISKPRKRFSHRVEKLPSIPGGSYDDGIRDSKLVEQLGFGLTFWTHIEEAMIAVFSDLVSKDPINPARQIFRSLSNNASRIKVMKAMLQRSPQNVCKGDFYDEAISEFEALNGTRNAYTHGLWRTSTADKKVYLMESTPDEFTFREAREVTPKEVGQFVDRLIAFNNKIKLRAYHDRMRRRSSPETLPPPDPEIKS